MHKMDNLLAEIERSLPNTHRGIHELKDLLARSKERDREELMNVVETLIDLILDWERGIEDGQDLVITAKDFKKWLSST